MLQAERMPELVHRFLDQARAEQSFIGEIQIAGVEVAVRDAEDVSGIAGQERKQRLGAILAARGRIDRR
jgi:hypothetical protein